MLRLFNGHQNPVEREAINTQFAPCEDALARAQENACASFTSLREAVTSVDAVVSMPPMSFDGQPDIKGKTMGVNYGFDKVRMISPVRSGSRIRGRFKLVSITDRGPKEFMTKTEATIEIEGSDRPALVAEWLGITHLA